MVGHLIVLSVPGDVAYFMTSIICKFSENDVVPPQAPKSRNASQLFSMKKVNFDGKGVRYVHVMYYDNSHSISILLITKHPCHL